MSNILGNLNLEKEFYLSKEAAQNSFNISLVLKKNTISLEVFLEVINELKKSQTDSEKIYIDN